MRVKLLSTCIRMEIISLSTNPFKQPLKSHSRVKQLKQHHTFWLLSPWGQICSAVWKLGQRIFLLTEAAAVSESSGWISFFPPQSMESVQCKIEVYSCRSAPDVRLACCSKTAGFLCDLGFERYLYFSWTPVLNVINVTLHCTSY